MIDHRPLLLLSRRPDSSDKTIKARHPQTNGCTERLNQTLLHECVSERSVVRHISRNVKHWRSGKMVERWVASGFMVAERRFNRIKGYRSIPELVEALKRRQTALDKQEVA